MKTRKLYTAIIPRQLTARISSATLGGQETEEIKAILERLEGLKEKTLDIMEELQELYKAEKNQEKQIKAGNEADELNERVQQETGAARGI